MTTTTKITITTPPKLRLSIYLWIVLYVSVRHLSQSNSSSVITNLNIFSSYSFLLMAGWWTSYFCRCSFTLWESQNICRHCQKCCIRMTWKNPGHWLPEPNFTGHWDRALLKPVNLGLSWENRNNSGIGNLVPKFRMSGDWAPLSLNFDFCLW